MNGQILLDGVEVRSRWAEYFEQVLNVADVRKANINVVQLAEADVGRFEWKSNIASGSKGDSE